VLGVLSLALFVASACGERERGPSTEARTAAEATTAAGSTLETQPGTTAAEPPATTQPPAPPPAPEPPPPSPPGKEQGPPDLPPPGAPAGGPPPAWIETEIGPTWLAYGGYCWGRTCTDYVRARGCDDGGVPGIPIRPGEVVRIHLAFAPREVVVGVTPGGRAAQLPPRRVVSWPADAPGSLSVSASARPGQGGSNASYAGCLEIVNP